LSKFCHPELVEGQNFDKVDFRFNQGYLGFELPFWKQLNLTGFQNLLGFFIILCKIFIYE